MVGVQTTQKLYCLKDLNSRYGYFDIIRSDNGPCYDAQVFKAYCSSINSDHITSSPLYPQSNGQSEVAVRILKQLLKKNNGNIYKSLLTYNSTPFRDGISPAQLFLGRNLRTQVPIHESLLIPKWPESEQVTRREKAAQLKQIKYFNRRHRAKVLPQLHQGDQVYVREGKQNIPGVIAGKSDTPRSYYVETPTGVYRRNRKVLLKPLKQPFFNDSEHRSGTYDFCDSDEDDDDGIPVANEQDDAREEVNIDTPRRSARENRGVPPLRYAY